MKNMRKAAILAVLVQLLVVGTLSCARPAESTPVSEDNSYSPDPTVYGDLDKLDPRGQAVVYWHDFTGIREEQLLSLVDEFNRTNEWGITILAESQGTSQQLYDRLNRGLPEKKIPGVIVVFPDQAVTYARVGVLVSVDPYMANEKWGLSRWELEDFFSVALNGDYMPELEERYGWPVFKDMEVLYYNEDWLVELGYDSPPETWDDFLEISCAAPKQPFSNSKGEGTPTGFQYPPTASQFATLIFSRGGDITDRDGSEFIFNAEEGQATLLLLRELETRDCGVLDESGKDRVTSFGRGWTLFTIASVHQMPIYSEIVEQGAGFNWSVSPPPHVTHDPRMNIFGPSLSILKTTPKEQLAAWLFIRWLSEPEQQAKWATGTGYLPVRRSAKELMTGYLESNPAYAKAIGYMAYQYGNQTPVPGYNQCQAIIEGMLTAVSAGGDFRAELDAAVEQCEQLLN